MRFDAASADCRVFTFKEGVLAAIAHDLEIRVTSFTIDVDPLTGRIEARFDAGSLRVVGAVRNGAVDPDALSAADKQTIEATIAGDVLDVARHPEIRFVSDTAEARGDALAIAGTLALHGHERALAVTAQREDRAWIGEARLHQQDFGIRPYRAMMGTLRVQPDVTVRITIPA